MNLYDASIIKINSSPGHLEIGQLQNQNWLFIYDQYIKKNLPSKVELIICETEKSAEDAYNQLSINNNCCLFLDTNSSPYSSALPSELSLYHRFRNLFTIKTGADKFDYIITTIASLCEKTAPLDFFNKSFIITTSDIIAPEALARNLVELGFVNREGYDEPGQFSSRGEIFDIHISSHEAYRLIYFDDMIEEIFSIDTTNGRTLKDKKFESIQIFATPRFILNNQSIAIFRSRLHLPTPQFKNRYNQRRDILQKLSEGRLFNDYIILFPLFFESNATLLDFFNPNNLRIHFLDKASSIKRLELLFEQYEKDFTDLATDTDSDKLIASPNDLMDLNIVEKLESRFQFITNNLISDINSSNELSQTLRLTTISTSDFFFNKTDKSRNQLDQFTYYKELFSLLLKELKSSGHLTICHRNERSREEISFLLEESGVTKNLASRINYIHSILDEGFYYSNEKHFVLAEGDLFAPKQKKVKKSAQFDADLFAEQLTTLKIGDYVIHKEHGVGLYQGLETIEVGGSKNDFLVLKFEGDDKVYVPIYRFDLIQKHADSVHSISLASLKSNKFNTTKLKAKSAVKKLAFDLLELNAKRKMTKGFQFSRPDHHFSEFELSFPFEETPDQHGAIADVIEDMCSSAPMDRLICGDVGFGKTEVAIRAAYKAVLDGKQVVMLVPTTILAYQHYNTFKQRLKSFAVNVDYISRFRTTKEVSTIQQNLANGTIDIIIGTHKLLSEKIKYHDLGLLIIDEEHRFGVGHKEKLKSLKNNLDCMTMTATPIPRTLQLSFLGVRDLSIIKTAPPRRQSIKSFVIHDEKKTIRSAIINELERGGQVFLVHNKVQDMEVYTAKIKQLVPNAKIVFAHGQLPERELEKRIKDFYEHKYDILIATTIIESGIDIPSANTMVVDRADTFGLAQLHQLRGRIGRSNKKAYAYFVVPENRILSNEAQKRLSALQTYADIGSGFALASSDLEIRGCGDILGPEQSGHIQNIGLELYMELLNEAMAELKGEPLKENRHLEIQTNFNALIPENYINNPGKRLRYYKRISNAYTHESIHAIREEIEDLYGVMPIQLHALLNIIECRNTLSKLHLKKINVSKFSIHLYFDQQSLASDSELQTRILNFFMERPKIYKFNPDNSIKCSFKQEITQQDMLDFSKHIAQRLLTC